MKQSLVFEKTTSRLAMMIVIGATVLALGRSQLFASPLLQLPEDYQVAQTVPQTPAQLQQLVAPIALYPDALVAQILAASTYPTQIAEADRWVGLNSNLTGEQLAAEVDQQSWEPSVKALTAFPSVLANLDMNFSWTSALGNAYLNQQQDVLNAVQIMRRRAQVAGNLQSSPQQYVTTQGSTIIIQPVAPDTCYLPYYDPWVVYGAPIDVYPGYIYDPWYGPPYVAFGPAIGIGFFGRFGWGWPAWGFNWNRRVVVFNRAPFVSRSPVFFHHFDGGFRGGELRSGPRFRSFDGRGFRGGFGRHR